MIRYSKSGSSDIASKMRVRTPLAVHRLKRRNTLFQSPNASRQGLATPAGSETSSPGSRRSPGIGGRPRPFQHPGFKLFAFKQFADIRNRSHCVPELPPFVSSQSECYSSFPCRHSYGCRCHVCWRAYRSGQMEVLAASSSMKLIDAGRMSRRTIADAIEVMRSHPEFSQHRRAKVRTFPLHLPSGDVPFLVQVVCAELALTVSLPTSKKFRAKGTRTPASLEFEEFETCLLDGASAEIIDEQLEVVLSDGRRLRGVQVIPCYLPPCGDGQRQKDALRLHKR